MHKCGSACGTVTRTSPFWVNRASAKSLLVDSLSRISRKINFFVREYHPKPTIPCKTRVLLDAQKAQDHLLRCKYT